MNYNFLHLLIFGGSWCSSSVVNELHTQDHQKVCEPSFPARLSLVSPLGSQAEMNTECGDGIDSNPSWIFDSFANWFTQSSRLQFFHSKKPKLFFIGHHWGMGTYHGRRSEVRGSLCGVGRFSCAIFCGFQGYRPQACKACTLSQGTRYQFLCSLKCKEQKRLSRDFQSSG